MIQALAQECSGLHALIAQRGETAEYHRIPRADVRSAVRQKVDCMVHIDELIASGTPKMAAYRQAASRYHTDRRDGLSFSAICSIYPVWACGGRKRNTRGQPYGPNYSARDWRMFIPNYTNGDTDAVLSNPLFCRYIAGMAADSSRPDAQATAVYERFLDAWFAGEDIPGIGNKYEWASAEGRPVPDRRLRHQKEVPAGCGLTNIWRIITRENGASKSAKRKLLQRGEFAAHDHWAEQLLRDRSKLMPLQLVTFDDVDFDIKVWMEVDGTPQVVRPTGLFALDVATGLILAKGIFPGYKRAKDGDGGKAGTVRGAQQADMRFLLLGMLEQYGLPADWSMGLLLENASASMSTIDKAAIEQTFTGRILFETTGRIRAKLLQSGFREQGGCPWQKGWVEAFFRGMHTRINHLPGTIGRRYDLTHGEVGDVNQADSKVHYVLRTLEDAKRKGIAASELDFSSVLLSFDEFTQLLDHYVQVLNNRTRHNLQGFNQVAEFETAPGEWMRADDPRAGALIEIGTQLSKRMESPAERFNRLLRGHRFTKPHPAELTPLYREKRELSVRKEQLRIKARHISMDDLIFRDSENAQWLSQYNGQDKAVMAYLSEDGRLLHCFTNDGDRTYLGSVGRVDRIDMTDKKAELKRSGEVHRYREQVRREAAELRAPVEQKYDAMRRHNNHVLGAIDQAEQRQRLRDERKTSHRSAQRAASEAVDFTAEAFGALTSVENHHGDDEDDRLEFDDLRDILAVDDDDV